MEQRLLSSWIVIIFVSVQMTASKVVSDVRLRSHNRFHPRFSFMYNYLLSFDWSEKRVVSPVRELWTLTWWPYITVHFPGWKITRHKILFEDVVKRASEKRMAVRPGPGPGAVK
jgi:hypothetical protein